MNKFVEYEKDVINLYKRGLLTYEEASNKISGYIKCLVDVGILSEDRYIEEYRISIKKIIDIIR